MSEIVQTQVVIPYRSGEIKQLAIALSKAQAEMTHASKDSTNPHFRSTYANLASAIDASREALTKNGLSVVQLPEFVSTIKAVRLTSVLLHSSGEFFQSVLDMPVGAPFGPQQIGSAVSYARRYAFMAMVGIAPDDGTDDDGNAAQGNESKPKIPAVPKTSNPKTTPIKSVPPDSNLTGFKTELEKKVKAAKAKREEPADFDPGNFDYSDESDALRDYIIDIGTPSSAGGIKGLKILDASRAQIEAAFNAISKDVANGFSIGPAAEKFLRMAELVLKAK